MLDVLIKGGKIYDGTGNPWHRTDVGIRGGDIVALGPVRERARRKIDAGRLAVCPGFVDVHTHSDSIVKRPAAENVLRQGVTTIVSGNCGDGPVEVRKFLDGVEAARPAVNFATLVGHAQVRKRVMGEARRRPTPRELARMRALVGKAMRAGAVGLSTGLIYIPSAYAATAELVELAKVAAAHGGVYASHIRGESAKVFAAIREAAMIGKRASIPVEVSHLKTPHRRGHTGKDRMRRALAAIRAYRESGIEITYDVYPYAASYTSLAAVILPPRASADGRLKERLQSRAVRRRLRPHIQDSLAWIGGADNVSLCTCAGDRSLEGRTLGEIARMRRQGPAEAAVELILQENPTCIFHMMRPEDVAEAICGELGMIGSDGGVVANRKVLVHPRRYGTFPRVLREYVREKKRLSLEEAVRKMTSLPARKFGFHDRGLIAVGMKADLVLFDARSVGDRATFERPHAYPTGIAYVIVNGRIAWNGRALSRERHGEVIRR